MKLNKLWLLFPVFLMCSQAVFSQVKSENLVQFSGIVLDGTTSELLPVPYVNISVKEKNRGTYSDFNGFFSIVVEKGDLIEFSAIGYSTVQFRIPDTLADNRYSMVQLMTQDTINLPETVVFPGPAVSISSLNSGNGCDQ
ncbi:MAG: carboxypeptidase-like regulatory domain-containing protein [Saprospiraceae bacterium]